MDHGDGRNIFVKAGGWIRMGVAPDRALLWRAPVILNTSIQIKQTTFVTNREKNCSGYDDVAGPGNVYETGTGAWRRTVTNQNRRLVGMTTERGLRVLHVEELLYSGAQPGFPGWRMKKVCVCFSTTE